MEYVVELRPDNDEKFQIYMQTTVLHQGFTKSHMHDFIELLYCIDGEYSVAIDANAVVINKGEMVVIGSRKIHTIIQISEGTGKYLVMKFQPEIVLEVYRKPTELRHIFPLIYKFADHECVCSQEFIIHSNLDKTLQNIIEELTSKKIGYEVALKSDIYRIILWFVRNFGKDDNIIDLYSESALKKIGNALDYIEKNYDQNISVRELADFCCMEYSYFSRIFKQITNKNCCDYVNILRIKKAHQLLCTTDMTITQIGTTVGFDSTSYFIKKFKEINGISPNQFRKI